MGDRPLFLLRPIVSNIATLIDAAPPKKSLNNDKRKMSLMKITMENQLILKRLQKRESYYNVESWEVDYRKREKILKKMCEYPYIL